MNVLARSIAITGRHLASAVISMVVLGATAGLAATVDEQVAKALDLWRDGEFEQAAAIASDLLEQKELTDADRVGIYSALSAVHYSMGKNHIEEARAYLEKIRALGPCFSDIPCEFWAKPLCEQWYRVLQTNDQLSYCEKHVAGIRSIAIVDFDNYSTGKYQEELGFLTKGLSDAFETDFRALNGLKVVERDKIDYVLREIMMTKEGLVDEATAVQAGKLIGAQIMVFGSVMQLDGKNARMQVKAVKVETGEILATAQREGKPDYFAMGKDLVTDLAGKLDVMIAPECRTRIQQNGSRDAEAARLYARGIFYVDHRDYAKAYDFFKQAYTKDPSYAEAKNKMEVYRSLAAS